MAAPLTPIEEKSFLRHAAEGTWSAGEGLLRFLGLPQQGLYSQMMDKKDFDRALYKNGQVGFRDVLRSNNLVGDEDNWTNYGVGLAGDVLLDPLNLIGVGGLTKAGKVVKAAGALDNVGTAMTKAVAKGVDVGSDIASRVQKGVRRSGKQSLSQLSEAELLASAPLRPRAAAKFSSIKKLLDAADAGVEIPGIDRIRKAAAGLPDDILNQPLKNDLNIMGTTIPIFSSKLPGGALVSDFLDSAAIGIRGTNLGRKFAKWTDKTVDDAEDLVTQNVRKGINQASDLAEAGAKRRAGKMAADLYADDDAAKIFSEAGNKAVAELVERPSSIFDDVAGKVVGIGARSADNILLDNPAVKKYVNWWDEAAKQELKDSASVGLRSDRIADANVEGYLPRKAGASIDRFFQSRPVEYKPSTSNSLTTMTSDQLARSEAMKVPGGRNTISFGLAKDKRLAGPNRLAKTDDEAADIIGEVLYGDAKAKRKETRELASIMKNLPDEEVVGRPLYGQHPTEAITDYLGGRARARKTAEMKLDFAASRATQGSPEVASMPASQALQTLQLKSGARNTLRQMIADRNNIPLDAVKLSQWFIPADAMNALTATRPVRPMAQPGTLRELLGWAQQVWRNGILFWPARYVRDKMGGMYVNYYEGVLTPRGEMLASNIIAYGAHDDRVQRELLKMPEYAGLSADEASAQFYGDLLASGITDVGRRLDVGVAGEAIHKAFPGANSPGKGAMRQATESFLEGMQHIGSMFSVDGKFARAGAEAGDIIDTSNRLSAYAEMLFRGIEPLTAAKEVKRMHVDYSSLTKTEEFIRDNFVPFYTFASRMLGEQAARILRDPGRVKRSLEVMTAPMQGDDPGTPDYIKNRFGFSVGGDNYMYGHADVPGFEQLALLESLATGNVGETVANAGSMLSPGVKTAIELFSGRQMAPGNLPTEQYRGNIQRGLNVKEPSRLLQGLDYIAGALPMGARATNLFRELAEEKRNPPPMGRYPSALLGNLTGVRVKTIDGIDRLNFTAENQIDRVKNMAPGAVRSYERNYIPKDALETLRQTNPRAAREYEVYKQLQSMRTERIKNSQNLKRGLSNPG